MEGDARLCCWGGGGGGGGQGGGGGGGGGIKSNSSFFHKQSSSFSSASQNWKLLPTLQVMKNVKQKHVYGCKYTKQLFLCGTMSVPMYGIPFIFACILAIQLQTRALQKVVPRRPYSSRLAKFFVQRRGFLWTVCLVRSWSHQSV